MSEPTAERKSSEVALVYLQWEDCIETREQCSYPGCQGNSRLKLG